MLYRQFGNTGWSFSAIGLGTWNIGNQWGELDDATSFGTVKSALDNGVNVFDTAESYGIPNGLSEERLGAALSGQRHNTYVISKIGNWGVRTGQGVPKTTEDMIILCAHASLFRLRTDYHDILLCHENKIEDPSVYISAFDELVKRGNLRKYGISTDHLDVLKRFNQNGKCAAVEIDYSLINKEPEYNGMLDYCAENGIGVLIRGPLAKGLLSGKYSRNSVFSDSIRAAWNEGETQHETFKANMERAEEIGKFVPAEKMAETALKYIISHPHMPVAIPGAKSAAQAAQNAAAGDSLLSSEMYAKLKELK